MLEAGGLALLDNQRTDQATTQFFAAADMGVIPVAAGIRHAELVVEILTGQYRQLRDVGHAVHFQGQADAVPVDGGGNRQMVDKAHPQPFALAYAQLGARCRGAKGPSLGLVSRHQLHVQRSGDQLVIATGAGVRDFPQPVAIGATGTDTHDCQADEATKDLSTGKGSGHNNLTNLRKPKARKGQIRYTPTG